MADAVRSRSATAQPPPVAQRGTGWEGRSDLAAALASAEQRVFTWGHGRKGLKEGESSEKKCTSENVRKKIEKTFEKRPEMSVS